MSGVINYDDVLDQIRAAGLIVEYLEIDTLWPKRVKVEGTRGKRGWYWLHEVTLDGGDVAIVGSFGVWQGLDNNTQKVKLKGRELTPQQKAALKTRLDSDRKRAKAMRAREAARASARASKMWAKLADSADCEYLARKGIQAHDTRATPDGTLVVPMQDLITGQIHGLQFIGTRVRAKLKDVDKQYWPAGMSTTGRAFMIGAPPATGGVILLCEGYATGATLHEATGHCTVVAFDAGNLLSVAKVLRKRCVTAAILVCADDDFATRGNPGHQAAQVAALAVAGAWVSPTFEDDPFRADLAAAAIDWEAKDYKQQIETVRRGRPKLTDFNDLAAHATPAAVRAQIEAKVSELGLTVQVGTARVPVNGEAGETEKLKPLLTVEDAAHRYSLVYGGGGSLFDHQEHQLIPKSDVLDLLEDHGWREWKRHPYRRVVRLREVGFDPSGTDETIRCNLWGGWPTVPKQGTCTVLLELLEYLCSQEENPRDIYTWVLQWLAYPIKHPGAKMKTALVFHGPQGAGKNMFFEAVMAIYGPYGRVVNQDAIEDKYNDWASKKMFLIADEVVARQELFHTKNKLKGFITGDRIRINPKHVAAHEEGNHLNIVFLSNEIQPLVLEPGDRRYTVIWTPAELSAHFYTDVAQEIANGGIEALHHFLATLDLGEFKPWTRPPMTVAKADLIRLSMESTQRFLEDWENGETPHPFGAAGNMDLYAAYKRWCVGNGVPKPRESSQFLAQIRKLPGWTNQPRHVFDTTHFHPPTRPRRIVIPAEQALSRVKKNRPDTQPMAEWLTEQVCEFAMTLEEQSNR